MCGICLYFVAAVGSRELITVIRGLQRECGSTCCVGLDGYEILWCT